MHSAKAAAPYELDVRTSVLSNKPPGPWWPIRAARRRNARPPAKVTRLRDVIDCAETLRGCAIEGA